MDESERKALRDRRIGLLYMLGCYGIWGLVLPVYIKLLKPVPVPEILAHRVLWAALFALLLLAALGRLGEMRRVLQPRILPLLLLSALLVTINWVTYIVAITSDHILASSLGYYMNPLVSVALGLVVLGERLRGLQLAACLVAAVGVVVLATSAGGFPWIALSLALSFGLYGLVRKVVAVESLVGFTFEAMLLAPVAALYLGWRGLAGTGVLGLATPGTAALLIGSGIVTALPLIWFAAATRKLPLTVIGLLQFISPTATFCLALFVYGESFGRAQAAAFIAIWLALALYGLDLLLAQWRAGRSPVALRQ